MKKRTQTFVLTFLFLGLWLPHNHGLAADLSWSGRYRFEGIQVTNSEVDQNSSDKSYFLQHLILSPRIIAADGIEIFGRFDLLNNGTYANGQLGQFLGSGPGTSMTAAEDSSNSNVLSRTQNSDNLQVTQLYLSWDNEHGAFIGGRIPINFGLGISHNAGSGEYDHWFNTKDIVGYKIRVGNLLMIPMYGKVKEGAIGIEDDVNDYMFQFQYDNPDSKLSMGLFYEARVATTQGNDAPDTTNKPGTALGGAGSTKSEGYKVQLLSVYVSSKTPVFSFGLEGGFTSGKTGIATATGEIVTFKGLGIATEFSWRPLGDWTFGLKAGMASGDDPSTDESFEGFMFNRNYDIAMLLFNHRLGQYDIFRTSLDQLKTNSASNDADTERISNVIYLAPSFDWKWTEKVSLNTRLIYALLSEGPNDTTSSDVGFELDAGITYRPYKRFSWVSELGFLIPGGAFQGGSLNYDSNSAFALSTKATISF